MELNRYPLPKEHGSIVMLIVSVLAGFISVRVGDIWSMLIFVCLVVNAYLLRNLYPYFAKNVKGIKKWIVFHFILLGMSVLYLILVKGLFNLIVMGIFLVCLVGLNVILKRYNLSFWGNLAGIFALSSIAPMVVYTGTGNWNLINIRIWFWLAVLFVGSAFFVKGQISHRSSLWRVFSLIIPSLGLILSLIASVEGVVPHIWPLAYAFPIIKSFWFEIKKNNRITLRKLGLLETVSSSIFLLVLYVSNG